MKTRPVHRGKIMFTETGKATGGAQGWGNELPNTCQCGSLPDESPKAQDRWQLMPKWSQEVSYWNLEGALEVPKIGDMNCSSLANKDPCQGEMPKTRSPGIPKDMPAVVSLHKYINVDTHYDVVEDVYVLGKFRRAHMNINSTCGTIWVWLHQMKCWSWDETTNQK